MPSTAAAKTAPSDYAELKRRVQSEGLLRKKPAGYLFLISLNLGLLALCLAGLVSFRHLPAAEFAVMAALGFTFTQFGFMGHDSGHRQMFEQDGIHRWINLLAGNLLMGMSAGWWIDKHNDHHANPNVEDMDPDIDTPIIAYSVEQANEKPAWIQPVIRRQAFLFLPVLTLLAWSMHISSVQFLCSPKCKGKRTEAVLLALHLPLFFGGMIWLFGWWALPLIVVHHALWGIYLGLVFAPNHKGMAIFERQDQIDFFRKQVLTARNVTPAPLTDWLYGGLNYQIEHHLFPAAPRSSLPRIHAIVRDFCSELGVAYHEVSALQSYRELFAYLEQVGRSLDNPERELPKAA